MGGRLLDWLGQGDTASRPVAAGMAALTDAQGAAIYYDNVLQILSIYDSNAIDWFEVDIAAVSAISFQTLPDVDWSTPPTDGQVFIWDTASSKLLPADFPSLDTEDVQDIVGAMFINGTGITASYDDGTGMILIDCTITQYTDEKAMDALAAAFAAGTHVGLTVTYDDALNKFDFALTAAYLDASADARIAAASINALSDVDTATTPPVLNDTFKWNGTNWVPVAASSAGASFNGARASLAAPLASANYVPTPLAITWDTEDFDAGGWFTLANPTYFTVPAGVSYVNCICNLIQTSTSTASNAHILVIMRDRGGVLSAWNNTMELNSTASARMTTVSGPIPVQAGDKLYTAFNSGSDTAIVIAAGSYMTVQALDSAGAVANTAGSGTSFPVSPTTGDRFFRTDRRLEYFWDGTRWLSMQVFVATPDLSLSTSYAATSANQNRIGLHKHGHANVYLEYIALAYILVGTGNWSVAFNWSASAGSGATAGTITVATAVSGTHYYTETLIGSVLTAAADFDFSFTENSGTASFFPMPSVGYRLVG